MIYIPFIISIFIGYFLIDLLFKNTERPSFFIHLFLGCGLGLGVSAYLTFTSFLIFDQLNPIFIKIINITLLFILLGIYIFKAIKTKTLPIKNVSLPTFFILCFLIILSIPLWYQSSFFAYGGWDAWSAWNLKAKFLFLGGENWKNMLDPIMWRSSPHYPLLLPLINVWGWVFPGEAIYQTPVFTSFFYSFITVCLLFTTLKKLTKTYYVLIPCIFLLTLPLFHKLSLSQYCDSMVAYYLLAGFICLIFAKENHCKVFAFLAGSMLGFLSFTKSEGLIAALLILGLSIPYFLLKNTKKNIPLIIALYVGACINFLPTIIFKICYSPGNQTFINGLTSLTDPSTLMRLKITFGFYLIEMFGLFWNIPKWINPESSVVYVEMKWCSVWILFLGVLLLKHKNCFRKEIIIIPLFLFFYWSIVTFYYFLNTHFQIEWWLQVTLIRVLLAILPTTLFWMSYVVWKSEDTK